MEKDKKKQKKPILGISLGRTNICVAVCHTHDGKIQVIPNENGNCTTTPFFVVFDPSQGILVGDDALALLADKDLPEENVKVIVYDMLIIRTGGRNDRQ